LTSANL
jgi:hypothetical protein